MFTRARERNSGAKGEIQPFERAKGEIQPCLRERGSEIRERNSALLPFTKHRTR